MARLPRIRPTEAATPDIHARLVRARDAGRQRAREALEGGWRRAPAQCPICVELIVGQTPAVMLAIMNAWLKSYHDTLNELKGPFRFED